MERTVGYETNLRNNINRKRLKYDKLIMDQRKKFNSVKFINLSISAFGVLDKESASFLKMLEDMHVDKTFTKYLTKRIINIAVRSYLKLHPFRSYLKYRNTIYAVHAVANFGPSFGAGHDLYISSNANKNKDSLTFFFLEFLRSAWLPRLAKEIEGTFGWYLPIHTHRS